MTAKKKKKKKKGGEGKKKVALLNGHRNIFLSFITHTSILKTCLKNNIGYFGLIETVKVNMNGGKRYLN